MVYTKIGSKRNKNEQENKLKFIKLILVILKKNYILHSVERRFTLNVDVSNG